MRWVPGGVVAILFACSDDYDRSDDMTLEVVSCEEAIAHLTECCPGFDPTIQSCKDREWQKEERGCESYSLSQGDVLPELSLDESRCVRELSCADIRGRGICEKVAKNSERGTTASYERGSGEPSKSSNTVFPHTALCP
jgi:hypothetical protein